MQFPSTDRLHLAYIAAGSLFFALLFLSGFGAWSMATFGNVLDGLAYLEGRPINATRNIIQLGTIPAGRPVLAEIPLTNLTPRTVSILGADTGCSCIVVSGLPMSIPARATRSVLVEMTPSATDVGHAIERPIQFFPAVSSPELWVSIRATVVDVKGSASPDF